MLENAQKIFSNINVVNNIPTTTVIVITCAVGMLKKGIPTTIIPPQNAKYGKYDWCWYSVF